MKIFFFNFLIVLLLILSVAPAYAGQFGIMTYNVETGAAGDGAHDLIVPRGYTAEQSVYLVNYDTVAHDYKLYVVDTYEVNEDLNFRSIQDEQIEVGAWGEDSEIIHLEAGAFEVVKLSFDVPEDVPLGEYQGGIVGTEVATVSEESGSESIIESGAVIQSQVAFRFKLQLVDASTYTGPIETDSWTKPFFPVLVISLVLIGGATLWCYGPRSHVRGGKKRKSR